MSSRAAAGGGPASVVSVAEGEDYAALVGKVLGPLGGIGAFVKRGDKVVVKPNISFDRTPEQGANTHPAVLKETVRLCLEAGASRVAVFDRTLADERRCYSQSGAQEAIESLDDQRVQLVRDDKSLYVPVSIKKGRRFTRWSFYKEALAADAYINLPVAKHHKSARLTLGLKNVLGVIGGNRGLVHAGLDQAIADLNTAINISLTIIDATRILLRNGPSGGSLDDVEVRDTLIASRDTVAADAYTAKHLFDLDPAELKFLEAANQLGLGEYDLDKIKVIKA